MSFENAEFEMSAGLASQLPDCTLPEIVFSGRSNVGKSSLINKLLNRKSIARVSSKPGKTATINFYNIGFCRFVDLPGYGYAKVPYEEKLRWSGLVEGYFSSGRHIKTVVQLTDIRRAPSAEDMQMIDYVQELGVPCIVAATKSDKLNRAQTEKQLGLYDGLFGRRQNTEFIPVSSFNGDGTEEIKKIILGLCGHK
ncbi:MAG TPA: YihA family ribosome biogenesis GTP-binding protein [Ruminococcaceae bacterium]|nr:YihA family ribosome biogenesis GTP-binding protein [Oscillospiraceae bacterium]